MPGQATALSLRTCRACEGAIVVAPAPERPIGGGMATAAMIVHVVDSKFCDSLPLYRQSQMLGRQGITLDRSTLGNWAEPAEGPPVECRRRVAEAAGG